MKYLKKEGRGSKILQNVELCSFVTSHLTSPGCGGSDWLGSPRVPAEGDQDLSHTTVVNSGGSVCIYYIIHLYFNPSIFIVGPLQEHGAKPMTKHLHFLTGCWPPGLPLCTEWYFGPGRSSCSFPVAWRQVMMVIMFVSTLFLRWRSSICRL